MNKFVRHDAATDAPASPARRSFLIGAAAAGGGLMMAFAHAAVLLPGQSADAALAGGGYDPNLWVHIAPDGTITVNVIRAEMGQHVGTALARILADELEADWSQVRIKHVDSDPKWGTMVTGGSWSVWQSFPQLSQAGAAARTALIEEGARLLGVKPAACTARDSAVHAGSRSVSYAKIVQAGKLSRTFSADDLKAMPIKPPSERRLVGTATQAIDIPGKTNGSAVYGIDAEVDGMLYGAPKIPPTRNGSKVVSVDDSAAKSVKGYLRSITLDDPSDTVPGWVVVLADSTWAAMQAAAKVKVTWQNDDTASVSDKELEEESNRVIADPKAGATVVDDDGVDAAFASAASALEQRYTTAAVLHFQLEPVNALALEKDGTWEIHTGNQWQSLILPTLAKALGVDEKQVVMRTYLLGGGFGRRLNGDYAVPAALAAKAVGKPVKLTFTRADDARFDSFRSPSVQRLRMAFDKDGQVVAMQQDAAAGWPTKVMVPAFMPKGKNGEPYDPFSISGADHWYNVGKHRVRALSNDLANRAFRPGWLRSVGPGWTNWALESFMDEAAHKIGADPVQFRLKLFDATGKNAGSAPNAVGGAKRQAGVVQRAAAMAGWGESLPADTGLGIATSFGQERDMPTWVACVARVKVDRASGKVTVEKLFLAVDAGTIVHPDGALAQVQGAALWGLSMALHEGNAFESGQIRDTNLDRYTPLRTMDVPALAVEFMPSTEAAVGLGEPATTVVGPAIANAIFAATGARLRHIPIRPDDVLKALRQNA
ncbi:xanthine dehydrogenase family protein molybdopterin-binding subunit [Dyella sp.]|jgi:CO/xanthine dehydrogenase Mo-binding subunit|uniref:xanthine dehydrogenase family protein molybdopterin-binding subunit n=1 Tax=Dyella sp. TaxID=1869338 RepID=UPI002D795855|nr:molybdopterin cofactor-binding domain-containing protein [Dyella sp.]HET6434076.1 molybdopterin cofactor-binding domain-containing protein [Dyella sp.]